MFQAKTCWNRRKIPSESHNFIRPILAFVCPGIPFRPARDVTTLYVPLQAGESIYPRTLPMCLFSHRGL